MYDDPAVKKDSCRMVRLGGAQTLLVAANAYAQWGCMEGVFRELAFEEGMRQDLAREFMERFEPHILAMAGALEAEIPGKVEPWGLVERFVAPIVGGVAKPPPPAS